MPRERFPTPSDAILKQGVASSCVAYLEHPGSHVNRERIVLSRGSRHGVSIHADSGSTIGAEIKCFPMGCPISGAC